MPRGDDAAQLHRSRRRARVRRRRAVGIAVLLAALAAGAAFAMRGGDARPAAAGTTGSAPSGTTTSQSGTARPATLRVRTVAQLPAPVQDAAVSAVGGSVYVFGGLDAAGTSLATVSVVAGGSVHDGGTLPVPVHDAASAAVGGRLLVLGGGQQASYPGIATFDRASRRTRIVATMPTPLSDLAVTTIGRAVYVVGGFTGTAWSSSILEVAGGRVRVVGHLPVGLRYAAVANVGGTVLVAGGRTTSGPSAAIYSFTPSTGRVRRIGSLPQPLMHASAGTLDGHMYVVGGIGSDGRPVRSVLAVAADGSVTQAGSLPTPLSDAGVATLPGHLVVVGGSMGAAPTPAVLDLRLGTGTPAAPAHHHHHNRHAGLPRMYRGPLPGDLLIADRGNDRILLINPAGRILWRYPSRPGQRRLYFDDDAFFTPGGRGIISNEEDNHTIVQIAYPSGKLQWSYGHAGSPGSGPGYLNTPDDAYRLRNGLVIVSDNRNCRLLEIRGHRVVRSIGSPASCVHDPPRSLASPNGDTPLPDGHILISEIYGSYVDEVTMTGQLVNSFHVPVGYPSDPQLTQRGDILLADYSRPGAVVIVDRQTGRLLWRYGPSSGPGELDHPSLASMLPNGDVMVVDDYNDRIVIVDPHTNRIVWQYGHTAVGGTAPGYLHVPDGFDFVPVTPSGKPDPAAIRHGP